MSNKHVVRFSWVEALLEESKTSPCFWLPDPRDHSPNIQYDLISSRASLYKDMSVILISGNDVNKDAYEEILVKWPYFWKNGLNFVKMAWSSLKMRWPVQGPTC